MYSNKSASVDISYIILIYFNPTSCSEAEIFIIKVLIELPNDAPNKWTLSMSKWSNNFLNPSHQSATDQ